MEEAKDKQKQLIRMHSHQYYRHSHGKILELEEGKCSHDAEEGSFILENLNSQKVDEDPAYFQIMTGKDGEEIEEVLEIEFDLPKFDKAFLENLKLSALNTVNEDEEACK